MSDIDQQKVTRIADGARARAGSSGGQDSDLPEAVLAASPDERSRAAKALGEANDVAALQALHAVLKDLDIERA